MARIRIWDLPTRLFHLGLIGAVSGALVTHYLGGEAMVWHMRFGYATLTLVLFRLGWGLFGSRYARFVTMLRSPRAIFQYALSKHKPGRHWPGHNPMGALSVVAMLGTLLVQGITGLLANDDIAYEGPLAKHIDKEWSDLISWVHADITGKAIYALIALHLLAVVYYRFKRRVNLVAPMLNGDMDWHNTTSIPPKPARDTMPLRLGALIYFLLCALGVATLAQL